MSDDVDSVRYEYNARCGLCGWVGDASSATEKCPVCWVRGRLEPLEKEQPFRLTPKRRTYRTRR